MIQIKKLEEISLTKVSFWFYNLANINIKFFEILVKDPKWNNIYKCVCVCVGIRDLQLKINHVEYIYINHMWEQTKPSGYHEFPGPVSIL